MQTSLARTTGLLSIALVTSLPAQITVSGGGASLAAAVAAAPDGAVLLVQPGIYTGFSVTGKGLTVLGAPLVFITDSIHISGTLPHQPFTLKEFAWTPTAMAAGGRLLVNYCDGPVLLENLAQPPSQTCLPNTTFGCIRPRGFSANQCANLYLRACSLRCAASIYACESVIESCIIEGGNWFMSQWGAVDGATALSLWNGTTQICGNSLFRGGNANSLTGWNYGAYAGDGIFSDGDLRVHDGQVMGGAGSIYYPPGYSIFQSTGGSLRISPRVSLAGNASGPQAGTDVMPQLLGAGAPPGGMLTATVWTEAGDLVILAVGLPGPSITLPGLQDPFWIDPAVHVYVAIGVQVLFPVSVNVAVPFSPSFLGVRLNWGAACQGPVTGFQATNPLVTSVH